MIQALWFVIGAFTASLVWYVFQPSLWIVLIAFLAGYLACGLTMLVGEGFDWLLGRWM